MLDDRRLRPVLESVPLTSRHGPFHRYVMHRYVALALERRAPLHILTGEWARRTGGRFNYPGLCRTAYVAADATTAQAEAERILAPYVHIPVAGVLQKVLDLTLVDVGGRPLSRHLSGATRVGILAGSRRPRWHLARARSVTRR